MSQVDSIRRLAEAGMARTLSGAPGMAGVAGDGATRKLEGAQVAEPHAPFQDELKALLSDVNDLQIQAGAKAEALAKGSVTDLHEVMLAQEEASVAFKLVLEMRNRIIAAYQEIMRMPV
jgi:flagellar hook-basal body complex protein FliE